MRMMTSKRFAAGLLAVGLAGALVRPAAADTAVSSSRYEQTGPHAVTVVQGGPDHTLYYPADLGAGGVQHPVLIWGNGTGVSPAPYDSILRHFASWGFVVAAANTAWSGSGKEMLAGARFLIAEDQRPGSVFYQRIDETKVGATGHSQGGGGAIAAGADSLVDTTIPIQPGPQGSVPLLKGPSLFIAGEWDSIVPSWFVRGRYSWADHVPAIFGELRYANHFLLGDTRIRLMGVATAWFRFWLTGDEQARGVFFGPAAGCGLCNDRAWSSHDRNAKATAIPG